MKSFNWSPYIKKTSLIDPDALFAKSIQTPKLIFKTIEQKLKGKKVTSILELGCSAGYFAKLFEKALGKPLYKVGVDSSRDVLNFNILDKYIIADLLYFKSKKKFDVVFSLGLFEHFTRLEREKVFLKHLELSKDIVIIGFPNVDYSLTYFAIKVYNEWIQGNRHHRLTRDEMLALVHKHKLKIIFEGYLGHNYVLQRLLRLKKALTNRFFLDYYLIILKK